MGARQGMLQASPAEKGPVRTVPLRLIEPRQPNQNADLEVCNGQLHDAVWTSGEACTSLMPKSSLRWGGARTTRSDRHNDWGDSHRPTMRSHWPKNQRPQHQGSNSSDDSTRRCRKEHQQPLPHGGTTRRLHPSLVQFDCIDPGGCGRQRRHRAPVLSRDIL